MTTPWHCNIEGSFAWRTCTQRWPKIVRDLARDIPHHAAALHSLTHEIEHGAVTMPMGLDDDRRFDIVADYAAQLWTELPWYAGEAWLYARIRQATGYRFHKRDPFRAAKAREEAGLVDAHNPHDPDPLSSALWRSLWGNRADLSLPAASAHTTSTVSELLVDERELALTWLLEAHNIAILLDNAGAELLCDLQLARALTDLGKRVTLIVKDAPYFVSDAIDNDIAITRRKLTRDVDVTVVTDAFLTGPGFLHTDAMPERLRTLFGSVDVVIAKGDCNYRRLVKDAPYDDSDGRTFDSTVDIGARVIALRTLKAEVLVGAPVAVCQAAAVVDAAWLSSGRFGVVQCAA